MLQIGMSRRTGTKALPPLSAEAMASLGESVCLGGGGPNEVGQIIHAA